MKMNKIRITGVGLTLIALVIFCCQNKSTSAGNGTPDDFDSSDVSGEWYGLGFQVDSNCRTDYLVGEIPSVNDFTGLGYDGGDEVEVDPSELSVEPNRPLTAEDQSLTFTWTGSKTGKKYKTTWDIKVSKTLVSQCERKEKAPVKYIEGEHLKNHNGTDVDPTSSDENINKIDEKVPEINARKRPGAVGTELSLDNVSATSCFEYNYKTTQKGYIHIYANIASNSLMWGDSVDYGDGKTSSVAGSAALDMTKVVTITNNGTTIEGKKYGNIAERKLTKDIVQPYLDETNDAWYATLYASTHDFQRKWLGVVPVDSGNNLIKLTLNKVNSGNSSSYRSAACGNWDYIELAYVGENEQLSPVSLDIYSSKADYLLGDSYDKNALDLLATDKDGIREEADKNQITLNEKLTSGQKSIKITYKGISIDTPVSVQTELHAELEEGQPVTLVQNGDDNHVEIWDNKLKTKKYLKKLKTGDAFVFKYNNSSSFRGKIQIYGNLASCDIQWRNVKDVRPDLTPEGEVVAPVATNNVNLKDEIKVTNNSNAVTLIDSEVYGKAVTSETDLSVVSKNWKTDPYAAFEYWTCEQFDQVKIAEAVVEPGANEIKIEFISDSKINWDSLDFKLVEA